MRFDTDMVRESDQTASWRGNANNPSELKDSEPKSIGFSGIKKKKERDSGIWKEWNEVNTHKAIDLKNKYGASIGHSCQCLHPSPLTLWHASIG